VTLYLLLRALQVAGLPSALSNVSRSKATGNATAAWTQPTTKHRGPQNRALSPGLGELIILSPGNYARTRKVCVARGFMVVGLIILRLGEVLPQIARARRAADHMNFDSRLFLDPQDRAPSCLAT
jgi:hypothetical protein